MNEFNFGVAFDLDGTLIDNNAYHILSWQEFYKRRNRSFTSQEFIEHFNGKTNADVLKYIFHPNLTAEETHRYTEEKEKIYREIYAPHIKPVAGLINLLELLHQQNIPMVIATSGIPVNIEFMLQHIPIAKYFKTIINSTHISHGKPHPEIYQIAAKELGFAPEKCIAFEDAVAGVQSAKSAGLKTIALTTTHQPTELKQADKIVKDFTEITMEMMQAVLKN
ncbi:fructose-1-phosphate phosphatase YqaB [mine drainage metagenome]|uniref:Fructose-1-phosphate phosphatase YqaB n=1 Tax=mine drainage metagenome TaxID=410659 RepID=A0A1J5S531_9ZZZZ